MATQRHLLDAPGSRWLWLWPLPKASDIPDLIRDLWKHGITGVVPQESDHAVAWAQQHAGEFTAAGINVVIGLGRIDKDAILRALDVLHVKGVMIDQEAWGSVTDSDALVASVLAARPDAADYIADCHYPCVVSTPGGSHTGHDKIAKAWSPICGLRCPQDYDEELQTPDWWVTKRIQWSRSPSQWPSLGVDPSRVRASVQMYRRSVLDHVNVLLQESDGSIWLWDWNESDTSCRLALQIVHALELQGHTGVGAVQAFQKEHGLAEDGVPGPATCAVLGVTVPPRVIWRIP